MNKSSTPREDKSRSVAHAVAQLHAGGNGDPGSAGKTDIIGSGSGFDQVVQS